MSDAETNNTVIIYQDEVIAESGGGSGGGGGSNVEPNPSGTPTDTLETLGIDGTIYEIQGGGGGSSGSAYRETVLWSGNSSTSAWASPVTMSLDDSIRKYDEIIIQFSDNSYGYAFVNIPTRDIPSDYAEKYFTNASFVYKNNSADAETGYIFVTADDEILGYTATGTTVTYTKVIGRKFGGNLSPIIYSTEEREIGVWIDNKPLYQKTCVYGSVSGTMASLSLDISNVDYISLCTEGSSVNGVCPISYVTGTNYNNNIGGFFEKGANNTNFEIRIGSGMAGNVDSVVLTVVYTKTTDVAGSGKYNTLGVPNVHYTTDEQVIGTWIDGTSVYKKVIVLASPTNISYNSWQDMGVSITGGDKVLSCFGVATDGTNSPLHAYFETGGVVTCQTPRNNSVSYNIEYLIIEYTKTTD